MRPNYKVLNNGGMTNYKQSLLVDNHPKLNRVIMIPIINYSLLKDKFTVGRWRVKEGSIKKK